LSDVTQILREIDAGDDSASEKLLPLVYVELRKLAASKLAWEKPGQTLQATALVHEAYLRLVAEQDSLPPQRQRWDGRGHFFSAAAEAMRRLLVERARAKKSAKRRGGLERVPLDQIDIVADEKNDDLLDVHENVDRLEQVDRQAAQIVKLRYFAWMSIPEVANALSVSPSTGNGPMREPGCMPKCSPAKIADQPLNLQPISD
jgi:RNA polymerase sigma factor (TIGR02999 family)